MNEDEDLGYNLTFAQRNLQQARENHRVAEAVGKQQRLNTLMGFLNLAMALVNVWFAVVNLWIISHHR